MAQAAPLVSVPADIELLTKGDANFAKDLVAARLESLGLNTPKVHEFMEACEFVSLGCYCGVSTAFQGIGVRKAAYPFDWTRSSVESVIHCFENDFEDFLTYTKCANSTGCQGFISTRWGGSFWHHNPEDPKTRHEFTRRIERLLGLGTVAPSTPRIFVRAVNSTTEIAASMRLLEALQKALPEAVVRLLLLIDLQEDTGIYKLAECGENVLFCRISKAVFDEPRGIHKVIDPYGEAIAGAVRLWAGDESCVQPVGLKRLKHLNAVCEQWDGGSPSAELFSPMRYNGERISVRRSSALSRGRLSQSTPSLPSADVPQSLPSDAPQRLPSADALQRPVVGAPAMPAQKPQELVQLAGLLLPAGAKAGDVVQTHVFGKDVRVEVPFGASGGQMMQLQLAQGVITYALAAAMATTASAALAASTPSAADLAKVDGSAPPEPTSLLAGN